MSPLLAPLGTGIVVIGLVFALAQGAELHGNNPEVLAKREDQRRNGQHGNGRVGSTAFCSATEHIRSTAVDGEERLNGPVEHERRTVEITG